MKVRNNPEHNKKIWQRMTKKEKVNFWIITTVIILLFLAIIAGGVVLGVTDTPWLLIGSISGFVGFGLSFPIIGGIKRKLSFKAIEKNKCAVKRLAKIISVWIGWHSYKGNIVKALTLNIKCTVNGAECRGCLNTVSF